MAPGSKCGRKNSLMAPGSEHDRNMRNTYGFRGMQIGIITIMGRLLLMAPGSERKRTSSLMAPGSKCARKKERRHGVS